MCKTVTYNSKQVRVFNLQFSSISIPWLLIGSLLIGFIWFTVSVRKHCKQRSRQQILRHRNLEIQNNRMSMLPFNLPNNFAQFPAPAAQYSQPGGLQQNQHPPTNATAPPDYPLSLKLNSAVV